VLRKEEKFVLVSFHKLRNLPTQFVEIVLLEKLITAHILKKFLAPYGMRNFVTVFIRVRHLSLPIAR
jgi:hypothetical protein